MFTTLHPAVVATVVSSFYLLFTTMFACNGVMRGAGDTMIPMLITLLALWVVRIPGAWILSRRFDEIGIWWRSVLSGPSSIPPREDRQISRGGERGLPGGPVPIAH